MKYNKQQLKKMVSKYPIREIGRKAGVSHPTIIYWLKKYGIKKTCVKKKIIVKTCKCGDRFIVITKTDRELCPRCVRKGMRG